MKMLDKLLGRDIAHDEGYRAGFLAATELHRAERMALAHSICEPATPVPPHLSRAVANGHAHAAARLAGVPYRVWEEPAPVIDPPHTEPLTPLQVARMTQGLE